MFLLLMLLMSCLYLRSEISIDTLHILYSQTPISRYSRDHQRNIDLFEVRVKNSQLFIEDWQGLLLSKTKWRLHVEI